MNQSCLVQTKVIQNEVFLLHYHFICCLSSKKAVNCITNTKDYFIPRSNIDINKILDDIEKLEVKENRKNEYSF